MASVAVIPDLAVERVKVRVLPNNKITRADFSKASGRTTKTLYEWARLGVGPMPHNIGGRVFYDWDEVQAFLRGEYVRPVVQ